ncbi:MAG: carboxypeptidase-like regulatory domain-containing protein [Bryobacteraceae bacterium]
MRLGKLAVLFVVGIACTFAQSDRGTITGTVTDPSGAVIANATIEARSTLTGAISRGGTTATGNYNIAQITTGVYELTVTAPGFKTFIRQNIELPVAATVRIDVAMEVGSAAESVTVSDTAPLLKTESGELSHNVTTDRLNNLPVMGIGAGRAGPAGIRNPYSVVLLLPGSDFRPDSSVRINGNPSNTQSLRIEGQDATNNLINTQSQTQPSVEAIQEFAIQTSNFAAEYGQVAGGFFNATMKSGTNSYHGTVYDYFVNESLNAGQAFTRDLTKGGLIRNRARRNDWGFTVGGPVWIPKIYDGHNKTFFFFNYEQFRETLVNSTTPINVPTAAYRTGDFAGAMTAGRGNVCPAATPNCDPLGRSIFENQIYDPLSTKTVNGQRVRDPFLGNKIPVAQQDPVALKVQSMIPLANNSTGFLNNYLTSYTNPRLTYIPSVKLDHQISTNLKVSGYWSRTQTATPNNNALPFPLNGVQSKVTAHTIRISTDYTITPTLLFHVGVGLLHNYLDQIPQSYDVVNGIGLRGTYSDLFPSLQGLSQANGGGTANMGPGTATQLLNTKPTANTSLTWVHNNHTVKAGGEMVLEGFVAYSKTYTNGWISFGQPESGLPSTNGQSGLSAQPGFNYASFMLGAVTGGVDGFIGIPTKSRLGNKALSGFVQDTWKVTRKLSVDYGIRYDFQTYLKEQYGRIPYYAPDTVNPAAGGRKGGVAFEGDGPGHCGCPIAHNYPWAFAPRLGAAYQLNTKTVIRGGIGLSYYRTAMNGYNSLSTGSQVKYRGTNFGEAPFLLKDGMPYKIVWPNTDPGQVPLPNTIAAPAQQIDQNAGRPARSLQYSISVQREVTKDFVVEASWVGNRGVWWNSTYLICPNCNRPEMLGQNGFDITQAADRTILGGTVQSAGAAQRGFTGLPYSGFPTGASLAQALRPFPQFTGITNMKWVPTGKNWYDSLQIQGTKRYSHGLDFTSSFTWSRTFTLGTEADISTIGPTTPPINDAFNRNTNKYLSGLDQPFLFVIGANYTTPNLNVNKFLAFAMKDWTFGTVLRYGSGFPIAAPLATTNLNSLLFRETGPGNGGGTYFNRVTGEPFFTQDLNCRCFDPQKQFVLNPKAWANPAGGTFSTAAAYYTDYRQQRRPNESMSFARNFRFREGKMNLQLRAEFSNVFNRTFLNNPTSTNALAVQTTNASTGLATAGFGFINTGTVQSTPRQGTLVGRFSF